MSSPQPTAGLPLFEETHACDSIYQENCKFCKQMSQAIGFVHKVVDQKEKDILEHHEVIQKMATKMSLLKDRINSLENANRILREKEGFCQRCLKELVSEKDCQENDLMASFEASYQNREVTD